MPKDKGSLGITPLKFLNMAMLSKWWWRFKNEKHTLWWNVIWSIHDTFTPLGLGARCQLGYLLEPVRTGGHDQGTILVGAPADRALYE